MTAYPTLDGLYAAIKNGETPLMDGLPTYGGDEPIDAPEIWSWDPYRYMVGTSSVDLALIPRDEWEGEVRFEN